MSADPLRVAQEHLAWAIGQGLGLDELHASLGERGGPPFRSWNDALWMFARLYSDLDERDHPGTGLRPISEALGRALARQPEPLRLRTSPALESELWPRRLRARRAA